MDINEAYKTLGVDKNISDDDLKVTYKKLAKEHHPDLHPDDQETFKKINAAHQLIQDYRAHPEKHQPRSPFGGGFPGGISINDLFNNIHSNEQQPKQINLPPIQINIDITFNESILGISKDIQYTRCIKCETCNGVGSEAIGNGCTTCNGMGRITKQSGNTIFTMNCTKCNGQDIKRKDCTNCFGKAIKDTQVSGSIQVPPGTENNAVLRLQGAGHYSGGSFFGDAYGYVFVNVKVSPENNMMLVGTDVVSTLKISMLDAMIGMKQKIKTVLGTREIEILPMSRNNDEVEIKGCGVANTNGTHRIVLDIEYPPNKDELITFLKGN